MVVAALGLWGCAQGGNASNAERIRTLENKCAKMEEDYRAVASARDGLRKRLTTIEEEHTKMQQDLEAHQPLLKERENLIKEKEDLVQQVTTRTTERNSAQTQLETVRKGLRTLLGQADAASITNRAAITVSRTGG
jgi:SMC interacting uncharacterized protein involved in chromosome segregation